MTENEVEIVSRSMMVPVMIYITGASTDAIRTGHVAQRITLDSVKDVFSASFGNDREIVPSVGKHHPYT